jgi:hypothetical protein
MIELLCMLWNQYNLATIRRSEFLSKQITGILNFANWSSDYLTFQKSEFQKKIQLEFPESETKSEFRFRWGSQKSEPKIGIPNQAKHHPNIYHEAYRPTHAGIWNIPWVLPQ